MIKGINHITFAVSDLKRTTSFYEDVFGLKKTVNGLPM
ncbi:MAG: VOC family protein [Candidatus Bathyarchaeota archaeon]|nr:VOC family protein [Candidatus Bathyarchaeota archaeon]